MVQDHMGREHMALEHNFGPKFHRSLHQSTYRVTTITVQSHKIYYTAVILLIIRCAGVGYMWIISSRGNSYTVMPQVEPCTRFPRLDIIRIRQPNAPYNEFIIPLCHNKYL